MPQLDRNEAHVLGRVSKSQDLQTHMMRDGILYAIVGELSRTSAEKQRMFMNAADLKTQVGISTALEEQGLIKGLEYTINFILTLGEDTDVNSSNDA